MRAVLVRSLAVLGIGLAVLAAILYYASTVDGRAPLVERIGLTQHEPGDERLALTTTTIEVEFSEPVRTDTAEAAFRLEPATGGEFSWSGPTLTFTPADRLPLETEFVVWVEAGVSDEAGNEMAEASVRYEFRTTGPARVVAVEPEDGTTDVPLDAVIRIEFSSLMDTGSVEEALRVAPAVRLEPAWSAQVLTLTPATQLTEATTYSVTIETGARDSSGLPLGEAFTFEFTTTRSPLEASLLVPADDSEGIAVTTPLAVFLDREVEADSVSTGLLSIEPEVAGTLELGAPPGAAGLADPTPRVLRFVPSGPLAPNTTYRVSLDVGLRAVDGSSMPEALEWSFTTGAPLETLSNQVVFLSDRGGVANLWAMNPDGSAQRQVSAELSAVRDYAVAPDGRSVVLADGAVLVLLDADGGGRTVLTAGSDLEFDPAWAPDGSRFAFGRADRESGEGSGIWFRDADGGDAERLDLPEELVPTAPPSSSPQEDPDAVLLRAPRFSPDGAALAYVDLTGRLGVVELPAGRLSTAPYRALGPPVWLRDSTAVVVAGLPEGSSPMPGPGQPVPTLDVAASELSAADRLAVGIGILDRGSRSVRQLGLPGGASSPAVSAGALLFIVLDPDPEVNGGALWWAESARAPDTDRRFLAQARVRAAAFGVEPGSAVAATSEDGIWLVDVGSGAGEQLSEDGWLPRWLP